jgi:GntR family transcriptional regulator, transcriptional repressor for pyruvate dehydrogenase complex
MMEGSCEQVGEPMELFEKVSTRKIYEEIADQIKRQIESGRFRPGDKLPSTKELSDMLQVGRSTVREALSALKAMGLVESRQGEGSFVRSIDPDQVELPSMNAILLSREAVVELIEARKALEIANAGLAAERRTEEQLSELERILLDMESHVGDMEGGESADIEFHLSLAKATGNTIMIRLIDSISSPIAEAIRETRRLQLYANKKQAKQLLKEHTDIVAAIRSGDRMEAQEAMRQHLMHVEDVLLKYLP